MSLDWTGELLFVFDGHHELMAIYADSYNEVHAI